MNIYIYICVCVCVCVSKCHEYIGGCERLKNKVRYTSRGLCPKKYTKVPSTRNSLSYLRSGPIGPAIVNDNVAKTPEKLDPSPCHPHYIMLHKQWENLDLDHRNCTSEHGEVALHPPQKSLSLSSWRSSYDCWSHLWSRTLSSPCEVRQVHWSHIYT